MKIWKYNNTYSYGSSTDAEVFQDLALFSEE